MTNNTIPNVPRELLERVLYLMDNYIGTTHHEEDELRAPLSAPSPAGVDGPVRNFKTREGYDVWDKLCAIPKFGFLIGPSGGVVKVADIGNWIDRDEAQSVVDEAQCEVNLLRHEASAAQAIIDGLRGEVADLHTTMMAAAVEIQEHWAAHCDEDGYGPANLMHRLERGIASQYGYSAETLVRLESQRDQQAQRIGELEGLLRSCLPALSDGGCAALANRIDFALSAGKEGE